MGRGGEGKGRGKGGDVKSNCMLVFGFGSSPSPLTACSFLPPLPSFSRCLSNGSTTQAGTTLHVEEDEGGCPAGPAPQDHPGLPL